jgi:hypothetical protein
MWHLPSIGQWTWAAARRLHRGSWGSVMPPLPPTDELWGDATVKFGEKRMFHNYRDEDDRFVTRWFAQHTVEALDAQVTLEDLLAAF